jgi:hypothetical protein
VPHSEQIGCCCGVPTAAVHTVSTHSTIARSDSDGSRGRSSAAADEEGAAAAPPNWTLLGPPGGGGGMSEPMRPADAGAEDAVKREGSWCETGRNGCDHVGESWVAKGVGQWCSEPSGRHGWLGGWAMLHKEHDEA